MNRVTASAQLNHPNDNSDNVSTGVEYCWNNMLFLRGGYKLNVAEQNYSFGAGFNAPISFANITVDYSFSNFEKLGSAQRFSISLGL